MWISVLHSRHMDILTGLLRTRRVKIKALMIFFLLSGAEVRGLKERKERWAGMKTDIRLVGLMYGALNFIQTGEGIDAKQEKSSNKK